MPAGRPNLDKSDYPLQDRHFCLSTPLHAHTAQIRVSAQIRNYQLFNLHTNSNAITSAYSPEKAARVIKSQGLPPSGPEPTTDPGYIIPAERGPWVPLLKIRQTTGTHMHTETREAPASPYPSRAAIVKMTGASPPALMAQNVSFFRTCKPVCPGFSSRRGFPRPPSCCDLFPAPRIGPRSRGLRHTNWGGVHLFSAAIDVAHIVPVRCSVSSILVNLSCRYCVWFSTGWVVDGRPRTPRLLAWIFPASEIVYASGQSRLWDVNNSSFDGEARRQKTAGLLVCVLYERVTRRLLLSLLSVPHTDPSRHSLDS